MKIKINKKTVKTNILEGINIESVLYTEQDVTVKDLLNLKSRKKTVTITAIDKSVNNNIVYFYPPVMDKIQRKFVNVMKTRASRCNFKIGDVILVA